MAQGPNALLEKTFLADGSITEYRIVKKGTNEDDVAQAAAATDAMIGVAQHTAGDNERVRVMLAGISKVEYGGNVTQGDLLTADAQGRAIKVTRHTHTENTAASYTQNASTQPATGERVIGVAMADGVAGDIGRVLLYPGYA